jgi:hypothetical protein
MHYTRTHIAEARCLERNAPEQLPSVVIPDGTTVARLRFERIRLRVTPSFGRSARMLYFRVVGARRSLFCVALFLG